MSTPACIIVDAYRFSKIYTALAHTKNMQCIHVQSTPQKLYKISTFDPKDYIANFIFDNNFEKLIAQLAEFNIQAVIPGTEPSVLLADLLASRFNVPRNSYEKSAARRDKYLMIEALRENHVPHVQDIKTTDYATALEWVTANTQWPVVAKPLSSAFSDNVFICDSANILKDAFDKIQHSKNRFGGENAEVLVEFFLQGTEYVVDTVSCEGKHYISDIWQCHKTFTDDHRIIYDTEELLPFAGLAQQTLTNYVQQVLNALEIRYGASHAEIMLTSDGPILIEIGARVGGHVWPQVHKQCLGYNQIELMIDSYLDPQSFFARTREHYQLTQHALLVILASTQTGIIKSIPLIEKIQRLPSFADMIMAVKIGDKLEITQDLASSPGKVILAHHDPVVIRNDYAAIKKAEKSGFILKS